MRKTKIIITGGSGRFGKILKNIKRTNFQIFFPNKKELDILNYQKINDFIKKIKPKFLIQLAGLSRPMDIHNKNIKKVLI